MIMKSKRFKREPMDVREVISVATTKHHDIFTNNECVASKELDVKPEYLSFMAANLPPTTANDPKIGKKIEDRRKKKIQDKVVKNGLVWN